MSPHQNTSRQEEKFDPSVAPYNEFSFQMKTPFHHRFVRSFKTTVPERDRAYIGEGVWVVSYPYFSRITQMIRSMYGSLYVPDTIPDPARAPRARLEKQTLRVVYLGESRVRDDGTSFSKASLVEEPGMGDWNTIFPEEVLKRFFETHPKPHLNASNPFEFFGLEPNDTHAIANRKYKNLLMKWHPDICREPNANEITLRILDMWKLISSPASFDAVQVGRQFADIYQKGTAPMSSYRTLPNTVSKDKWIPPERSGMITAMVSIWVQNTVEDILDWTDIKDAQGRTLISSWDTKKSLKGGIHVEWR